MQILMFIVLLILIFLFVKYSYKKCNAAVEKIVCIILVIIYFTPILIYYLDLWNIPSALNLVNNINSQNWLAFLSSYTSSIVSTMIGVTASISLAFFQIRKNNEDTEKRDKENLRLQNMPLLKCELNTYEVMISKPEIKTKFKDGNKYTLNIKLKNIGLNAIKSIKVDFDSEINNNKILRLLGKNTQKILEKNEEVQIKRDFKLEYSEEPYNIKLFIYYEDVLNNWYEQIIEVIYNATNQATIGGYIGKINYNVNKEIIIEEEGENYEGKL